MKQPIRIYVGWDDRQDVAFKVLRYSIIRKATQNKAHIDIDVIPLKHADLRKRNLFRRPWITDAMSGQRLDGIDGRPFSTEFSHTRFLVPHLNGYQGWALFMDCDMLFTSDIRDLMALCNDKYACMVVKHDHKPKTAEKMDGQRQINYFRKNWSSFVLWNCAHPSNRTLSPEKVSFEAGGWLHAFEWLPDHLIGALPPEYNWIEGVSPNLSNGKPDWRPKVIHYTEGGPWLEEMQDKHVAFGDSWCDEYEMWQRDGDYITGTPTTKFGG